MKTSQVQVRGGRGEGISLQHTELICNSTGEHYMPTISQLTSHSVTCHCVVTVSTSDRGDSSPGYIIRLTSHQFEWLGGGVIKVGVGSSR